MKHILVCVNYNSYDSLMKYLQSVDCAYERIKSKSSLTVLVADNAIVRKEIELEYGFQLSVVTTGDNLGYFGGATYAIKNSHTELNDADFIYISNVDLTMNDDFFEIIESETFGKEIGCVAPTIYSNSEEKNRNPKIINRPTKKKMTLLCLMYRFPILYKVYTKLFYSKRKEKMQGRKDGIIYAPHGSFMAFRNNFSSFLTNMEYPVFLFGEEIYITENLRMKKLKTLYYSKLKIEDSDHVSTSKLKSKAFYRYNYEAMKFLTKEYFYE